MLKTKTFAKVIRDFEIWAHLDQARLLSALSGKAPSSSLHRQLSCHRLDALVRVGKVEALK